jgi:hypothetical protein
MNFNKIVERRCKRIKEVLGNKEKEYAVESDRFYNFKVAGELLDCTPTEALLGHMSKHICSVIDILVAAEIDTYLFKKLMKRTIDVAREITKEVPVSSKRLTLEHLDEKIGDTQNYLILLEGLLHQLVERNTSKSYDDLSSKEGFGDE